MCGPGRQQITASSGPQAAWTTIPQGIGRGADHLRRQRTRENSMSKKPNEQFFAVYRPDSNELVITRTAVGPDGAVEADYKVVATDLPDNTDIHGFIDDAKALVREAGWIFRRKRSWTPRTVVRVSGESTEWVWAIKRARTEVKIHMTESDFHSMLTAVGDSVVAERPDRFECDDPDFNDPRLITQYSTRGRAEGVLAREYLRTNGWRVVEAWDTEAIDVQRPWIDEGPCLLTDRPWRSRTNDEAGTTASSKDRNVAKP